MRSEICEMKSLIVEDGFRDSRGSFRHCVMNFEELNQIAQPLGKKHRALGKHAKISPVAAAEMIQSEPPGT